MENPLSVTHRDGLAKALQRYPEIMSVIERAEATGIDLSERKESLNNLKTAAEALLDKFFDGYRLK